VHTPLLQESQDDTEASGGNFPRLLFETYFSAAGSIELLAGGNEARSTLFGNARTQSDRGLARRKIWWPVCNPAIERDDWRRYSDVD
jgi:hypothetical protein